MHSPKQIQTHTNLAASLARCCIMLSALFASGCATVGGVEPDQTSDIDTLVVAAPDAPLTDKTMALDIVRSASQLYTPLNTTLQFNNQQNDPLLEHFIARFTEVGFGIQRVSADQGSNYFSYTLVEDRSENGKPLFRLDTSIGAIKVGRDYTLAGVNTISPASPVRIAGTRAVVKIDDTPSGRFVIRNTDVSRAIYTASLNIEDSAPAPVISLITNDLVDQLAINATEGASLQSLNSNRVEVINVFHTRESNFTSILDDYKPVHRQIVVFGNDSLVLGDTNKLLIEQFANQRVRSGDLISLLGCSNGHTDLEIGNEGLALGRAKRMTEALLAQGIERNRILEEGCWAPVAAGEDTPTRGVVMELWRKL